MPNSLNTRLLRVTNEEENGEVITQIRPREYDYNISYVDNFDGFVPYHNTSNTSDVRISYDYTPYGTTLSNSADTRLIYYRSLETFFMNIYTKYSKKSKKSKIFYNKI